MVGCRLAYAALVVADVDRVAAALARDFGLRRTDCKAGDTGAMALGGAIAGMAIFLKVELLLLLVGGIFVIEALSVMLQVISFKWWGRRVFLMAPLHHHFEMKAWSETKIMVRFWIVAAILCASGFALFYRDFLQFVGS